MLSGVKLGRLQSSALSVLFLHTELKLSVQYPVSSTLYAYLEQFHHLIC